MPNTSIWWPSMDDRDNLAAADQGIKPLLSWHPPWRRPGHPGLEAALLVPQPRTLGQDIERSIRIDTGDFRHCWGENRYRLRYRI